MAGSSSVRKSHRCARLGLLAALWLAPPDHARAAPATAKSPTPAPATSPASAIPTATAPSPASACLAARALSGLTPDEQQSLTDLCSARARPDPQLAPLLVRLATRASWEAAALGELLVGAAPHLDLGADVAAVTRLVALRRALQQGLVDRHALDVSPACHGLRDAVDDYLTDRAARDAPVPPFSASTLADGPCVPLGPDALADVHLLTVPADGVDGLFVAAGTADRVVLQWFAARDAVVRRGGRVFVVAVPRWSVVTVRAATRSSPAPALWHGFVTHDQTIWDRPPAAGCLRVSVDLDPATTLLLDGQVVTRGRPLAHHAVGVLGGAHELVALRCERGACAVRFRETLPETVQTTTANLCQAVALDLHQPRSVALLRVSAAPGCDTALAWQAGVVATDYLRRSEAATGRQFRDLASYASLTEALGSLRTSLNPAAGAAVGGAAGPDSLDTVATAAKEAWRQGIDELVSLELRCGAGEAADLALEGSIISVRDVFSRGRGEVEGLDLKQLLRVESLRMRAEDQLDSTVASVLDRLLGRSHLRIREGATVFAHRRAAPVELVAYGDGATDGRPTLAAYHVADPHRRPPALCRALAGPGRVAALQAAEDLVGRARAGQRLSILADDDDAAHTADHRSGPAAMRVEASLRAGRPGTYLVVARWRRADGRPGPVADATCLRFDAPARELWGAFLLAPDLTTMTPVREYSAFHLRAQLGHTWYRPLDWLGLGIAGTYAFTRHASAAGLPSWQDLDAEPATSVEPLRWYRHALLLGPVVEARTRRATWPVSLRARLGLGAGLAVTTVGSFADLYPEFATDSQVGTSNLRLRPTIDATLDLGIGYDLGPLSVAHAVTFGAVALNDMSSALRAVTATTGASLFVGLNLILGGQP